MSIVSTVNLGSHPDLAGNLEMWGFEKRSKLTKVPLKKKKKTYTRKDRNHLCETRSRNQTWVAWVEANASVLTP